MDEERRSAADRAERINRVEEEPDRERQLPGDGRSSRQPGRERGDRLLDGHVADGQEELVLALVIGVDRPD